MKKIKYYISALLLMAVASMSLTSCSEDSLGDSIFPDVSDELDPTSYTYDLDQFLKKYYLDKYNLTFLYKMPDVSTNMYYNLVPATYENSKNLAVLCKHLWFDVYDSIAGEEFLKTYGPRIILLVGSPAYNPTSGTEIVGLAEGGIKVSLFKVNELNKFMNNFDLMNEYYFKTMHHEFAHILHQTKTYPNEFNTISIGHYDSNNWQDRSVGQVASLGFVTTYASSEFREDFAETIANYIVKTDEEWNAILDLAARGWTSGDEDDVTSEFYCYYYYPENDATADPVYVRMSNVFIEEDEDGTVHKYWRNNTDKEGNRIVVYDVEDKDGIDGVEAILQKVQIARTWLQDAWGVDLDELRNEVQYRQTHYDINDLRKQVTEIQ